MSGASSSCTTRRIWRLTETRGHGVWGTQRQHLPAGRRIHLLRQQDRDGRSATAERSFCARRTLPLGNAQYLICRHMVQSVYLPARPAHFHRIHCLRLAQSAPLTCSVTGRKSRCAGSRVGSSQRPSPAPTRRFRPVAGREAGGCASLEPRMSAGNAGRQRCPAA